MSIGLNWNVFLRVSTEAKCDKAIEKIRHALPLSFKVQSKESYWKDRHLYKVIATSGVDAATPSEGFYRIMKALNGIARSWTVRPPVEGEVWEFSGASAPNSATIPEIDSVSCSTIESNRNQTFGDALTAAK
jgi:hypothetical protein